jgi:periplasmic divalent cation tolerance protein
MAKGKTAQGKRLNSYILILTTVPDKKTGQQIAKTCVGERLAACVTISGPSESHYQWEGKLVQEHEHILFIKTREALFPELKEKILKLHPYQVPEIIALPLAEGHPEYLKWIDRETNLLAEE